MDDGIGGNFTTVVGQREDATELATSFIAKNVSKGLTYRFRCRVKNAVGWSDWSSPDSYIIAATKPSKPATPVLVSASSTQIQLKLAAP